MHSWNKAIAKIYNSLIENDEVMIKNGKQLNDILLKERQTIEEDIVKQRRQLALLHSKGNE